MNVRVVFPALFLALCLLGGVPPLSADTLILRNGKKLEGKIVSQSRFQIRFRTAKGIKSVSKSSVKRVLFGGFKPPEKKSAAEQQKAERLRKQREQQKKERTERLRKKRAADRKKQAAESKKQQEPKKKAERKKPAQKEPERPVESKPVARPKPPPGPTKSNPSRTQANPFLRSAVLPGWGQNSQGRDAAAYTYGATFLGFFAVGAVLEWENLQLLGTANRLENDLRVMIALRGLSGDSLDLWQTLRLDQARIRSNNNIRLGNSIWTIAGLVYAANLIDVSLAGGSSLALEVRPAGGSLAFRMRF